MDRTGLEKTGKSVRFFRKLKIKDCKRLVKIRLVSHCHTIFLLATMKMNQNSSKSDENWVRYDQNRVNHVEKPPLTWFWSYLTQFSPNLLDLGFIFKATCCKKLQTNNYNQYKLLLNQECPRPVFFRFFAVQSGFLRSWDIDRPVQVSVHHPWDPKNRTGPDFQTLRWRGRFLLHPPPTPPLAQNSHIHDTSTPPWFAPTP